MPAAVCGVPKQEQCLVLCTTLRCNTGVDAYLFELAQMLGH
jgi:hypothetical protein